MNPADPASLSEELDRALERRSAGVPLDDVLSEEPALASQLRRLLTAASAVDRAVRGPSPEQRRRARNVLLRGMRAHPGPATSRPSLRRRLALGTAAAALSLAGVGTAAAQAALPGDLLFGWKLSSEEVWRTVSLDPLRTDLALLERRTAEWIHVRGRGAEDAARARFYRLVARLASHEDPDRTVEVEDALILAVARLAQAGVPRSEILPATPGPQEPHDGLPEATPIPLLPDLQGLPRTPLPTIDLGL